MTAIIRYWNGEEEKRFSIVRACFFTSDDDDYGGLCVGWADIDSQNAKHDYHYFYALARLADAIGIDDKNDLWAFRIWWNDHGAIVQQVYARHKKAIVAQMTFAEWVRDAFLDWLEPMSEDDREAQERYNDSSEQDWIVMGEERSAKVISDYSERDRFMGGDGKPHKLIYTPGDYPTFRMFFTKELNEELIKWTGR